MKCLNHSGMGIHSVDFSCTWDYVVIRIHLYSLTLGKEKPLLEACWWVDVSCKIVLCDGGGEVNLIATSDKDVFVLHTRSFSNSHTTEQSHGKGWDEVVQSGGCS